jgi:hypothetical protein
MPADRNQNVLAVSRDRRMLMLTAVEFARSPYPDDLSLLQQYLSREEFLDRLDSEDDYLGPPKQLRVARVLKTLMDNASGLSHDVLVTLAGRAAWREFEPRLELLIRALVVVRPAPDAAVAYWDEFSQPDEPFLHVTVDVLADNGSTPALGLLIRKIYDAEIEDEDKIAWFRGSILRHRNDELMLQACRSMLRRGLPDGLDPYLVEALFDYRKNWYLSCNPPVAPPRSEMTSRARQLLREVGRHALEHIALSYEQRVAVENGLSQIGTE